MKFILFCTKNIFSALIFFVFSLILFACEKVGFSQGVMTPTLAVDASSESSKYS
jgi:hypothetical protein